MGNRLLHESIKFSKKIASLSCFQESMYYRLIVTVDDFGRYYADPQLLRSSLFPLREDLTITSVEEALVKLESAGLIKTYTAKDDVFLEIVDWSSDQRVRALISRFPGPQ